MDVEEKNAFLRRDIIKSKGMELFYDTKETTVSWL